MILIYEEVKRLRHHGFHLSRLLKGLHLARKPRRLCLEKPFDYICKEFSAKVSSNQILIDIEK